jgi:hypothetical protein
MASYEFDYTILVLRQAIDFAEIERDFVPLRKWVNEIEQSGHDLGAMEGRLNFPIGQDVLMATLLSVSAGSVSPDEALLRIRRWLNSGQMLALEKEYKPQYQMA